MTEEIKDKPVGDIPAGEIPAFKAAIPAMLEYVSALVKSDEILLAEKVLISGMPGFFRDNPPKEVLEMRRAVSRHKMTIQDYANDNVDFDLVHKERSKGIVDTVLRGQLLLRDVKELNEKGKTPHLIEIGPGEYWLPIGLSAHGCKFTYQSIGVHDNAYKKAKPLMEEHLKEAIPGEPIIYAACEIIEHVENETDIAQGLYKSGFDADIIHMSTPLYTFGFGKNDWAEPHMVAKGAHLRTYTPSEFMLIAQRLFPNYNWVYYHNQVMSLRGSKNGG